MSDSESDCFDDEEVTQVGLGYIHAPITARAKPTVYNSKLGGTPVWFHEDSKPSLDLIHCKICSKLMAQLLQVYVPLDLEDKYYDRVMYLFACKDATCSRREGSIRVIRGIHRNEEKEKQEKQAAAEAEEEERLIQEAKEKKRQLKKEQLANVGTSVFGATNDAGATNPFASGSSNPFESSANPFANGAINPFSSKKAEGEEKKMKNKEEKKEENKITPATYLHAATGALENPPTQIKTSQPWPKDLDLPSYPGYFVDVEEEVLRPLKEHDLPADLKDRIEFMDEEEEADMVESAKQQKEKANGSKKRNTATEDNMASLGESYGMDKGFQKFCEVVGMNPEQIIRYEFEGKPLLYSNGDKVAKRYLAHATPDIPLCPLSREQRVYELQLMPHAIEYLEAGEDISLNKGMEWGTIIVATSRADAMPELDERGIGYTEEWVDVQWEDVSSRK